MTATQTRPASAGGGEGIGRTLPSLLLHNADVRGAKTAIRSKDLGRWVETTWSEYALRVAHVATGMRELGVQPGEKVSIHSENRVEWLIADLAAQGIGATTVGIYPTSPTLEVLYLLEHSESVLLIDEDEEQLDKVMEVREKLPGLRHIAVIDTHGVRVVDGERIITFADLEARGAQRADAMDEYRRCVDALDPETTAIIVYTSGTTGPPKGAMVSHGNLMAVAEGATTAYGTRPDDEILSYLPLCHIAERLISVIDAVYCGYVVNFGEDAETFTNDLREVQPTFFLGVPRVWEKMLAGIQIRMNDASWVKRTSYQFWIARGRKVAAKRMAGSASPIDRLVYGIGWVLLYRSLREKLGLSRVRVALSGAAPIAPQVLEYFWALGVPVREAYAQTENTALCTYTPADDVRIGTVGKALPGVEIKIADDGEIITRSPGVFQGYFKNPAATAETVDAEGWLHTGDIGVLDADGFLTITDRKKDIIITAGGKNISPSEIENKLKVSPYIREAIVIGDKRKYLTALIGIELDTVGDWAARRRISYTTYRDLTHKPEVAALVQETVDAVNAELAQVETVKRFTLLPKELDPEDGELTATQKVKRASISREFEDLIEAMYGSTG